MSFFTYGGQWTDASFPIYILSYWGMGGYRSINFEYAECHSFWFASWGEKICCKVKRTSFVAIDSAREVTKSQPWRGRTLQGHISSYSTFDHPLRWTLRRAIMESFLRRSVIDCDHTFLAKWISCISSHFSSNIGNNYYQKLRRVFYEGTTTSRRRWWNPSLPLPHGINNEVGVITRFVCQAKDVANMELQYQ